MDFPAFSKKLTVSAAACALVLGFQIAPALAQGSGSGAGGGSGQGAGRSAGHGAGQGGAGSSQGQGQGQGRGSSSTTRGTPGKGLSSHVFEEGEGPSSDAKGPQYGGGRATTGKPPEAGTKKGDEFGDLWVILRDANGVPILNSAGFVQPLDKDGNLIPLDAEGAPLDETQVVEVELGRTNVSRSSDKVLERRLTEAVAAINAASSVSLDSSGRLVLTTDGVAATIDSPLENLAIYKALLSTGTIPGITDPSKLGALAYLADGTKTSADLKAATGFLAAATDKEEPLNLDEIQYLNSILGVAGAITGPDGASYVDYSSFTYDRQAVYGSVTEPVLVETSPGTYQVQTVNIYDTLFKAAPLTATEAAGFTAAADDARTVLLYLHDNAPRTTSTAATTTPTVVPNAAALPAALSTTAVQK